MHGADTFNVNMSESEILKNFNREETKLFRSNRSQILKLLSSKSIVLPVKAKLEETADNFNDMGFMQAIDIISANFLASFSINNSASKSDYTGSIAITEIIVYKQSSNTQCVV